MNPNSPPPEVPGMPGPGGGDSDPQPSGVRARTCVVCGVPVTKKAFHCVKCRCAKARVKRNEVALVKKDKIKSWQGRATQHDTAPEATMPVKADQVQSEIPTTKGWRNAKAKGVYIDYKPHPKQEIFGEAIRRGAKIIFFLAGIRSGKTVSAAYELLKQIYVYDRTPNLFYMVSPTNAMTRNPIRIFQNAAGDALIQYKRASDQGPAIFMMRPSASVPDWPYIIEHHSGEHPERMKGSTVAGAWLDEPQQMKPEVMDVVRGRVMESGGIIMLSGTASFPGHWTKTEIVDNAWRCGKCGVCVYDHYDLLDPETRKYGPKDHEPVECTGDPRIAVIVCSTFDNTYIPKAEIEQLRKDYARKDPLIARRELFGEYVGFEGLVYSHFDRTTHASEYTVSTVPRDAYIACGIDFGVNDPFVCVFGAKIKDTWHIIGEYYTEEKGVSLKEHAQRIKQAAGPIWPRIKKFWHDPSGRIAAMELNRYGLRPMIPARKRKTSGQNWKTYRYEVMTSHMMARDDKNKPLFRISPECKRTLGDFESRKWKRYLSKGEDGTVRVIDLKGHEVDRNAGDDFAPGFDHGTDSVEYLVASEFVKGLYNTTGKTKNIDTVEVVMLDEKDKPQMTPEQASLGRYLGQSMEEKRKKLVAGKFKIDRFQTGY